MTKQEFAARLAEVKAQNLPPLSWRDVLTLKDGAEMPDDDAKILDAYFSKFVALPKNEKGEDVCLGCQLPFYKDGLMSALLGGAPDRASWEWGLAHGVCYCTKCGWPARAYHYDIGKTDDKPAIIARLNVTLPVHPSLLTARADTKEAINA